MHRLESLLPSEIYPTRIMHEHAVETDMVDVFAVDFEVLDGLSAGKLLDSDDRSRPTVLQPETFCGCERFC